MSKFAFSQLVDAHAIVYGDAERMKLERMSDTGMFPKAGKGALLPYSWAHVRRIVLAMEMHAMGLPLAELARRFDANWPKYNDMCVKAERGGQGGRPPEFLYYIGGNEDDEPVIGIPKTELVKAWKEYLSGRLPRFLAVNLTMRLAEMKKALEATPPRLRGRPPKASSATAETKRRALA